MLSDVAVHDCPAAIRLIQRGEPAKRLVGDKAYDNAELWEWLDGRGTRTVIPNRSNRNQRFNFS